jgi:hypothetical protein
MAVKMWRFYLISFDRKSYVKSLEPFEMTNDFSDAKTFTEASPVTFAIMITRRFNKSVYPKINNTRW